MPVETFGLWANKGGVGKSTLCFHISTTYGYLYPEKTVIVVDMCPQANLSHTLLTYTDREGTVNKGSDQVALLKTGGAFLGMRQLHVPRTVAGYLHDSLKPSGGVNRPKPEDFLVKISDVNQHCPDNMYLLAGDSRLDDMSRKLANFMDQPRDIDDPYKMTLSKLRDLFDVLEREGGPAFRGKDITVFIDTNPAFTEYTQVALCSMTKLIVPVNADDFSLQAVDYMFNRVWNLFEQPDAFSQGYRADSFACKASERAAELLPKIACIVHNRHAVRSTRATVAFDTLHQDSSQRIWEGFQAAKSRRAAQSGRSPPVFSDKGNPNQEQFCRLYTATMREMFGTGVASAHTGIPLHRVLDAQSAIHRAFNRRKNGGIIRQDTCANLIADLLKVLAVVLDDYDLHTASQEKLFKMALVGDRAHLKLKLKWGKRKKAWVESMAAAGVFAQQIESEGEEDNDYVDPPPELEDIPEEPAAGAAAANGAGPSNAAPAGAPTPGPKASRKRPAAAM